MADKRHALHVSLQLPVVSYLRPVVRFRNY